MWAQITSNDLWAKALRIVLVFSLVFWVSFRVESFAFAKVVVDDGSGHGTEGLSSISVYGLVDDNGETKLGEELGKTGNSDEGIKIIKIKAGASIQVGAVTAWGGTASTKVTVPDVVGKTRAEAESVLADAGLKAEYGESADDYVVTGTDPEAGAKVDPESSVTLTLKAPEVEKVTVPDVVGETRDAAVKDMSDVGLKLLHDDIPEDAKVTSTEPSVGTEVERGSEVGADWEIPQPNTSETESIETESIDTQSVETKGISPQGTTMHAQAESDQDDPASADDVVLSNFLDWTPDNVSGAKTVKVDVDKDTGAVTISGLEASEEVTTITCTLPENSSIAPVEGMDADKLKAQFKVQVVPAPYISSIELYKADDASNTKLDDNQEVVLPEADRGEDGTLALSLRTVVNVEDESAEDEAGRSSKITLEPGEKLADKSENQFNFQDLKWSILVDGAEVDANDKNSPATIENGVLSLKTEGPVTVVCQSDEKDGRSGKESQSQRIVVMSDKAKQEEKADIQGESAPQQTLTVTIDDPYAAAKTDANTTENETNNGDSANSASQTGDGQAANGTTPEGENASGNAASSNAAASKEVSKTYHSNDDGALLDDKDELVGGGAQTMKFTMNTATGGTTVVDGRGTTLQILLDNAGISQEDQKRIESIEFVSAKEGATKVTWSDLVNSTHENASYIVVAPLSRVQELDGVKDGDPVNNGQPEQSGQDEQGGKSVTTESSTKGISPQATVQEDGEEGEGGEGGEVTDPENQQGGGGTTNTDEETPTDNPGGNTPTGNEEGGSPAGETGGEGSQTGGDQPSGDNPSTSSELLSNTRYRILYQGSIAGVSDPLKLRYVNQIIVHMAKPEDTSPTDAELSIHIDYVPAPRGEYAYLSANPNNKVGASQFNYKWEISTNDGATWSTFTEDAVQTLRIMTDDPDKGHIGHKFRVILETDLKNPDGTNRGATSEPVTIIASTDFAVALDYTPALAGDYANFTTHLQNYNESSDGAVTYVWEMNTTGNWDPIPGAANAPSWSTKTNPIDPNASSNPDAEPVSMTYIRVRATTASGKTAVSNAEPLTVRVGDGSEAPKTDEINNAIQEKTPSKKKNTPTITEIPSIEFEDDWEDEEEIEDDDEGDDEETTTNPATTGKSPEIVVNNKVSNKIKEQNKKAKEKKDSDTPGARWTEISAMNPTQDDLQRIFANNPFAPFAIPTGLGLIFAGGLEKLISFRRQL